MKLTQKSQSLLEIVTLVILVAAGIILMRPYVIRAVNAHLKTWEDSAEDSFKEKIEPARPEDFPAPGTCGNGVCESTDPVDCCQDCGNCGDGTCCSVAGESAGNCSPDCGKCGDNICLPSPGNPENFTPANSSGSCCEDCSECGDGWCCTSSGPIATSSIVPGGPVMTPVGKDVGCAVDCQVIIVPPTCPDGNCDTVNGEDRISCPEDCASCFRFPDPNDPNHFDGWCTGPPGGVPNGPENVANCAKDCCPPLCGNGQCDTGVCNEGLMCPPDCCGNGTCEGNEDITCPGDCVPSCGYVMSSGQCIGGCPDCVYITYQGPSGTYDGIELVNGTGCCQPQTADAGGPVAPHCRGGPGPEGECNIGFVDPNLFLGCCPSGGNSGPPQPPCPACFLGGTLITMADGSKLPIENVRIGDRVLSFDAGKNTFIPDQVTQTFQHQTTEYLIINGHLKVTANHPIFNGKDWVEIGSLKAGDSLFNDKNQPETIKTIAKVKEPVIVYNLEVNPAHTYIAGGYLVHNKDSTNCGNGIIGTDECAGACLCPGAIECDGCISPCN